RVHLRGQRPARRHAALHAARPGALRCRRSRPTATRCTVPGAMDTQELKIEELRAGTGEEATTGRTVDVHYTGWLTDGKKFDSSVDRGRPFSFPLGGGRVIKGWDQGVVGMRVGGKRKLTIPPHLGYGPDG